MAFQTWEKAGQRGPKPTMQASVWPNGKLYLSQGLVKQYRLDRFGWVVRAYDPETGRLRLQFAKNGHEPGSVNVLPGGGWGLRVHLKPMLDAYHIPYDETRYSKVTWDEAEACMFVPLKEVNDHE